LIDLHQRKDGQKEDWPGIGAEKLAELWQSQESVKGAIMGIRKVLKKYKISEQPNAFSYWESRSYEERLETLEQIRKEYNSWRYNAEQGFQRIYRVVKRT